MRNALSLLMGLAFFGCGVWVIGGRFPPELWVRAAIFAATVVTVAIVLAVFANAERAARLERNARHSQQRGYRYREEAPLAEFVVAEDIFPDDARIESVAEGERKGAPFAVFDLSWTETTHGEGGSSTTTIAQTVAMLPGQAPAGVPLPVIPFHGLGRSVFSFLGLTGSVSPNPKAAVDEPKLLAWFEQNYHVTWDDETRDRAESVLQLPVLRWLRDHPGIALELAAGRLLVWRPHLVIDAEARDDLVDEALDLAAVLSAQVAEQGKAPPLSAFQVQPPAVASLEGVFWRMVVSGFASWAIACVTALGLFFAAIVTGVLEAVGPQAFVVPMMTLVILVWVGSGFAIHSWLSRPARGPDER